MNTYNQIPCEVVDGYRSYEYHPHQQGERIGPLVPFLTGFVAGAPFWSRPYPFPPYSYFYPYPVPYPYPIYRPRRYVYRPWYR